MTTYTVNNNTYSHQDLLQYVRVIESYWNKGLITNWEFATEMQKVFATFQCPVEGYIDPNTGMKYKLTAQHEHKG